MTHNSTPSPDLSEFKAYLLAQNRTANTINAYTYAVRQFNSLHAELTKDNLMLYKAYLLEHYKPRTANVRIRAMNAYLEFTQTASNKLSMIKIQQKTYVENVISEADYEYLKIRLASDGKWLYYFLIRYMAATGARVSEVTQITVDDVTNGYKDLYSKANKYRRIYIPKQLVNDTLYWLKHDGPRSGPLFTNRSGNIITADGIRKQLKKNAVLYGISTNVVYPHAFRHRFAKSFIEKCSDIALLSDLLGHENLDTTRIYLRRTSTEQQQLVNKIVNW